MAAKTFTTWQALYQDMLNALADFAANRMQVAEYEMSAGGTSRRFKYRTLKELQDGIAAIKPLADSENGTAVGRTYAKNGGGGRW